MPCGRLEIQDRLARVAAEQLALQAGTEPTDPEPAVAGDVRQAAEPLETGLASLSRGTQTGGRNGSG